MPRTIPIALQPHIRGDATTLCIIVKIIPVQPGYDPFGITTLDHDIEYDDGNGLLNYSAAVGAEPSNLQSSADLSVAGGETKQLQPVFDTPMTEAQLAAGACDYAKFVVYIINYNDLTSGNHVIYQTGTLGRNSQTDNGLSWTAELRGLTQPLKQSITEKWSLTCRAVFGSTVRTAQSRYPCNFPLDTLWSNGVVLSVGVDDTQLFYAENVATHYNDGPGLVEWLTGANAGRSDETELFTVTGSFAGTGTFTGTGDYEHRGSFPSDDITCTGTGTFDGTNGGTFHGTGTWTGKDGRGGDMTFSGQGTYAEDGTFVATASWKSTQQTLSPNSFLGQHPNFGYAVGTGTFTGTGTGSHTLANVIGLTFGAAFAIKAGDTFRYRDDCPKSPTACKARNNWPNYRGEPSIPVADNGALAIGVIGATVTTTTGD